MENINFLELVDVVSLQKMAENLYAASGIPIGIIDANGIVYVKAGWQDICTKFHRVHPISCDKCYRSDIIANNSILNNNCIEYRCENNMWDIAIPLIISKEHIATIYIGQFFYDDEIIDMDFFKRQAAEYGFDEKDYLEALKKIPIFSRKRVQHMVDYYIGLVTTLAESGLRHLEYMNSQNELTKCKNYLDTIFNFSNDSIFIHDFYDNILDVNQTATTMFGYSKEELITMKTTDLLTTNSSLTKLELIELLNNQKENKPITLERVCKTKEGMEFFTEVSIRTICIDENDEIMSSLRDITDRKLFESAMKTEAREMETLRSEFFGNISHELRTPLNIILGATQIVQMSIQDEENPINRGKILSNLSIEKQNCFRLLKLINNLIDSTKLDSGYYEVNLVNWDIINIVEEITLSVADYIHNNNLTIIFDTDIEEKVIACDIDKLERIMLNLLSNAIKFTPAGGRIFVNIFDGEDYITITIEDTGIGIPAEKLDIVFDRFRQIEHSFTKSHQGSGIGLSLVKSLVDMQGGSISVESKLGYGTKFFVKLPVKVLENTDKVVTKKEVQSNKNNCVERIKVEFSDIYKPSNY